MAQAIDIHDREGLRNVIREINLDDYKQSNGMADLVAEDRRQGTSYKDAMLTEDELLNVIQYLRAPSGRGDKTRLEYMAEHNRGKHDFANSNRGVLRGQLNEDWMSEKRKEEMEYMKSQNTPYSMSERNVFMEERTVAQPQKPNLEDIKARYMREMDALTKKFQEEINGLG